MVAVTGCRTAGGPDLHASPAPPPGDARSQKVVRGTWKGAGLVGVFWRGELEAITAIIARETWSGQLQSIERRGDDVVVMTGYICGLLCGHGDEFILREVDGSWTVVKRLMWES